MGLHCAAVVVLARVEELSADLIPDAAPGSGWLDGERIAAVASVGPTGEQAARLATRLEVPHEALVDDPSALQELADRFRGESVLLLVGGADLPRCLAPVATWLPRRLEVDDEGVRVLA